MKPTPFVLYAISIIGSGCGFVTQMLVSGYWSTAYSHDVLYFSINAAFYFLSLGIGSLLSTRWKNPSVLHLIVVTAAACLWTGISVSFLKLGIRLFENAMVIPVLTVLVSGVFAGQVIPLTIRVRGEHSSVKLSTLFFLDYSAAIGFTLVFTFVLLIPFGYGRTAVLISAFCLAGLGAVLATFRFRDAMTWCMMVVGLALPYTLHAWVSDYAFAPKLRQDATDSAIIVHNQQSHYQKIVLTEERGENQLFPAVPQHVLYLDGFVQFSSLNEQNYHACIANVPLAAGEFSRSPARTALILGGGDGLVARNLLAIRRISKITLVELDPAMIKLAREELKVRMYNLDSLRNPRVEIIVNDAFQWVRTAKETYDLVVIDFPAPKNVGLSRLFSAEFYSNVFRLVRPNGFVSIQAGPSYSVEDRSLTTLSKVTTCIKRTLASIGRNAHVHVNPRDNEAFLLVPESSEFDATAFFTKTGMLATRNISHLCIHSPQWKEPPVAINTLNTLTLSTYMVDWFEAVGGPFFRYAGAHSIFLPE